VVHHRFGRKVADHHWQTNKKVKSGGGKPAPKGKGQGKGKGKDDDKDDGPELGPTGKPKRRPDQPKKVKLRDQKVIPVPRTTFAPSDDDDLDSDDDIMDMDLGEEEGLEVGAAGGFLASLEPKALSR
jgi:nucleolar complex protein 3